MNRKGEFAVSQIMIIIAAIITLLVIVGVTIYFTGTSKTQSGKFSCDTNFKTWCLEKCKLYPQSTPSWESYGTGDKSCAQGSHEQLVEKCKEFNPLITEC